MAKRLLGDVKRVFLTGGAGFIGSHVVDILMPQGYQVTVYDNFSNGHRSYLDQHRENENLTIIEGDITNEEQLEQAMKGHDLVWHLAANTDIIGGAKQPERDLKDGVVGTFAVLNVMRKLQIKNMIFASSGAAYGKLVLNDMRDETAGPLLPVGVYGAAKVSCEAFISSFCNLYGMRAWMYRFGNVIGGRMTHGVIFDFVKKLQDTPERLLVLGDGTQQKNYFLVEDCINGMMYGFTNIEMTEDKPCDVFNLGTSSVTKVVNIAQIVKEEMNLPNAKIEIEGSKQAWPGDQPKVNFSVEKMTKLGWTASRSSDEAVREAVRRHIKSQQ